MHAVQKTINVDVPAAYFFDVITDFDAYPEFLPDCRRVRILHQNQRSAHVVFEVRVILSIRYTLRLEIHRPHRLVWTLVEGDFLVRNDGSWTLNPLGEASTEACYELALEPAAVLPATVARELSKSGLGAMMQRFKAHAEARWSLAGEQP